MKHMEPSLALVCAILISPLLRADLISDWNKTAREYLNQHVNGHESHRGRTMMHVAQFDAVNAAVGGYTPYALNISAPDASPEAAAAQAAYTVLTNISRSDMSTLNSALNRSMRAIPDGPAKEAGIHIGRLAGETIIRLRAADNVNLQIRPPGSGALGKWRPTPPDNAPGESAQYQYLLPWTMRSQAQFRPGPPPSLRSEQYAADFEEVRLLGARVNSTRTPDQTDAADFHDGDDRAYLHPVLSRRDLSLIESARLFALFHMVWADAVIAFLEAQYHYSFWRPITAIRNADNDGNDATRGDPTWSPFLDTPAHPEYPSGTCANTGAMVEVVMSVFGDDFSFTGISRHTSKPRNFPRLSAAFADAITGRIAAGGHFRSACVEGIETGRQIARHALDNFLRPVPTLTGSVPLRSGQFYLHLHPGSSAFYVIDASPDLNQWAPVKTNASETLLHTDPVAGSAERRFYRTRTIRGSTTQ